MFRSLPVRLAVLVGTALGVGLLAFLYVSMAHHEHALLTLKREEASLLAATIKGSLVKDMLAGMQGREAIQAVMREIGQRPEIERVRIFDAVGNIRYSSDPTETGHTVDKAAENCVQCHSTDQPLHPEKITDRSRFFYTPSDTGGSEYRVMGVIEPIRNAASCHTCHHDKSRTVLGVLDVVVSLRNLDQEISLHRRALALFGIVGVVVIIGVVVGLIHFQVGRPVARLVDGTRKVGLLNLDYRLPVNRKDELGRLAEAFNEMTEQLGHAQAEIREFTQSLHDKVREKTKELQATQVQMLRAEKMAAIGQMAAGVAHEINNPLTGVITLATLLSRRADPGSPLADDLDTIIRESRRCSLIARGLLDFARGGELVRRAVDPSRLFDRVLDLVEHQALFHNIEVVREYAPDVPLVGLDVDRIEQVLLNLVMNSAEAMEGKGTLRLGVRIGEFRGFEDSVLLMSVGDTGPGIPEEDRPRVFEPFFTTKETGQGTGLGLAVSYRIVDDHGGRIVVESELGKGTIFTIAIPLSGEVSE